MTEERELSPLEKEFKLTFEAINGEIQAKLDAAAKLIKEAEQLSSEHGIPFGAAVSPLSQSYYPNSFRKKYPELDTDFVRDVTGTWSEYDYGGWEHSQVC